MSATTPKQVLEYSVERVLGRGLLGEVYLAKDYDGIMRAVKVVNERHGVRLKSAVLFVHQIVDENLGQYLAVEFDHNLGHCFVMDYLEVRSASPESLEKTLSREFLEMAATIAEKLDLAHQKSILHGNIKTSNLLLRRAGPGRLQPILNDFGIGYVWDERTPFAGLIQHGMAYMAPERIQALVTHPDDEDAREGSLTPASDLYSLTCVIVEALSGQQVFRKTDTVEGKLQEKAESRYLLLNINYPIRQVEIERLNAFIERNLSVDPQARIQDGKTYAQELRSCLAAVPQHVELLQSVGL
ncbi:serine/threonine protein kinase [Planctomycetota bacterium]